LTVVHRCSALLIIYSNSLIIVFFRLSREIGAKVASNEQHIENISIQCRPMNLSEEYHRLCTNDWYEAKCALDDIYESKFETNKMELLRMIFEVHFFSFLTRDLTPQSLTLFWVSK
jgi:hypothetical protein